jgi:hypothetical protein
MMSPQAGHAALVGKLCHRVALAFRRRDSAGISPALRAVSGFFRGVGARGGLGPCLAAAGLGCLLPAVQLLVQPVHLGAGMVEVVRRCGAMPSGAVYAGLQQAGICHVGRDQLPRMLRPGAAVQMLAGAGRYPCPGTKAKPAAGS